MTRPALPLLLAVALLSACGSTVGSQVAGQPGAPLAGDGLSGAAGTTGDGLTGGGAPLDGTATGVGGSSAGSTAGTPGTPGTTGPGTAGSSMAGGGAAPRAAGSGPTGTARPLVVGMVKTSTQGADSIGLKLSNTYSEQQFYDALFTAINAKGGFGGRRLQPVYDEVDPFAQSWAADFAAACEKFTRDEKVDVVIGYVFNYDAAFESCLASKGIPHLSTTFNVPDAAELSRYPLLVNVDVPTITRRTLAKLDGATATGALTSGSKIGLMYDTCPGTQRSYEKEIKPALARYRLSVASDFQISCVNGQGDSGNSQVQLQSMAFQFKAAGVTHVLFHSVSEGPALVFLMQNAQQQEWFPTYVMSSLANLMFITTNPQLAPERQARNVKAFGWLPFEDVTTNKYPKPNATQKRCLQLLESRGVIPKGSLDFKIAYTTCEVLFVLERGLLGAGGAIDGPSIVRGVQAMGTSFESASKLDGAAAFGAGRNDAVLSARPLVWVDVCKCYDYTGSRRDIPNR